MVSALMNFKNTKIRFIGNMEESPVCGCEPLRGSGRGQSGADSLVVGFWHHEGSFLPPHFIHGDNKHSEKADGHEKVPG